MAKAGNSGFEDRWLERYENEKARAEKAPQWQAFRVIPAAIRHRQNFCVFASIFAIR